MIVRLLTLAASSLRAALSNLIGLSSLALLLACGPTQKEIDERDQQAKYHYQLAYGSYFEHQSADAALQQVLTSLKIKNDDNPDAHLLAGLIFLGRKMYPEAIHHFKTADSQKNNFFYARNNLGVTYLEMGNWDGAIQIFAPLTQNILYRTQELAHNNLGWAYYKKGLKNKAKQHFETAILLQPKLCIAYNNLGIIYIEDNKLDRAEKFLKRGIKRCETYAEPYFHMSKITAKRGDFEGAARHLRDCIKHAGESTLADRCEVRLKSLEGSL